MTCKFLKFKFVTFSYMKWIKIKFTEAAKS